MTNDPNIHQSIDPLKRSMVRLADTVRTLHRIAHRVRNGLSSDEFPDPVFRDYDIVGSTDRIDSNRDNTLTSDHIIEGNDHVTKGLYNVKIRPRKRASYEPYL